MNNKNYFFILWLTLHLLVPHKIYSQTGSDWQPIFLTPGGANIMDGIEASFLVDKCNGEDIINIRFINKNEYAVKLEWFDAVFTEKLTWVKEEGAANKKSLLLPVNGNVSGHCSNNLYPQLIVKVKKFVVDKKEVKRYLTSELMVISVQ